MNGTTKIGIILLGIMLFCLGISIMTFDSLSIRDVEVTNSTNSNRYPLGIFFILAGILIAVNGIKTKKEKIEGAIYKCLKCGAIEKGYQLDQKRCKICNSYSFEKLEGFFERHPEYEEEGERK